VCDVLSRGVLGCGRTERARDRELGAIGLQVSHEGLTTDERLAVVLVIVGMLSVFMIVFSNGDMKLPQRIVLASGAALGNWFAVLWATEPRERRWAIVRAERPGFRPIRYYVVAGLGAAATGFVVRAFSRVLIYGTLTSSVLTAQQWAAWVLVDVATAVMIAVNIDNRPRPGLRWIEAASQGLVSTGVAWVIARSGAAAVTTSPGQIMFRVGLFGFVLGLCVPSWYRDAPRTRGAAEAAEQPPAARAA